MQGAAGRDGAKVHRKGLFDFMFLFLLLFSLSPIPIFGIGVLNSWEAGGLADGQAGGRER